MNKANISRLTVKSKSRQKLPIVRETHLTHSIQSLLPGARGYIRLITKQKYRVPPNLINYQILCAHENLSVIKVLPVTPQGKKRQWIDC